MRSDYTRPETYVLLYPIMQYPNVLALRLALETGLRIDDVLSLKWDQFQGKKFTFEAKKTKKRGKKIISGSLLNDLTKIRNNTEWVFPGRKKGTHRTRQAVWRDMVKAAKILGVEGHISPHSARKTYAVKVYREKGLEATKRELQHTNDGTTLLYALADGMRRPALNGLDLDALADKIARKVAEKIKNPDS